MPIKIGVAFVVLMATLAATMMIVSSQMQSAFQILGKLF
jgi:hypothetical protein